MITTVCFIKLSFFTLYLCRVGLIKSPFCIFLQAGVGTEGNYSNVPKAARLFSVLVGSSKIGSLGERTWYVIRGEDLASSSSSRLEVTNGSNNGSGALSDEKQAMYFPCSSIL